MLQNLLPEKYSYLYIINDILQLVPHALTNIFISCSNTFSNLMEDKQYVIFIVICIFLISRVWAIFHTFIGYSYFLFCELSVYIFGHFYIFCFSFSYRCVVLQLFCLIASCFICYKYFFTESHLIFNFVYGDYCNAEI